VRDTEVPLAVPGAGAVPRKVLVVEPQPTRSTTSSAVAQAAPRQVRRVVLDTSATFAPDPDIAMVPSTSGVGRSGRSVFAPDACATRNEPPAEISPVRFVCPDHVDPVADPYCTDQPSSDTGSSVGLWSSTKSRSNAPPLLPPPP
jgi:hypothetical protein